MLLEIKTIVSSYPKRFFMIPPGPLLAPTTRKKIAKEKYIAIKSGNPSAYFRSAGMLLFHR